MYRVILIFIFTAASFFTFQQISFAACGGGPTVFTCDTTDPNPDPVGIQEAGNDENLDISVLPGAGIDTTILPGNDDGIEVGNGNNNISIEDCSVVGQSNAISAFNGDDTLTVNNSIIHSVNSDTIDLRLGNNVVNIIDSIVTSEESDVLRTSGGNDVVNTSGSELKVLAPNGSDRAISTGPGEDRVNIENTILQGGNPPQPFSTIIDLGAGNDTLILGNGVVIQAEVGDNQESDPIIQCGSGFDTIVFAMDVPEERLNFISGELAQADPSGGSITINGLFYEWVACEQLVNELVGVRVTRPIPTLSEWGLIAMAGVLGLVGLIAIRKKYITA